MEEMVGGKCRDLLKMKVTAGVLFVLIAPSGCKSETLPKMLIYETYEVSTCDYNHYSHVHAMSA